MLKNAFLLAIVAVHTAENEPSEVGALMTRQRWWLARLADFGAAVEVAV